MMSQDATLKFLMQNGVEVTHMSYNLLNDIIAVADRMAEKEFKNILLTLCEANHLMQKEGAE